MKDRLNLMLGGLLGFAVFLLLDAQSSSEVTSLLKYAVIALSVVLAFAILVSLADQYPMPEEWREVKTIHEKFKTFYQLLGGTAALILLLIIGVSIFIDQVTDFSMNVFTEVISVTGTILILNRLTADRAREQRKKDLIEQLGSRSNEFALEAARLIWKENWQIDGSLKRAELWRANLEGVELWEADLEGAELWEANLMGAEFGEANLMGADLFRANLSRSNLNGANLKEADLSESNLEGTDLQGANLRDVRNIENSKFR